MVFSFDEKSPFQAMDRRQPSLSLKKGRPETMTHDYKLHGTTTRFAALDVATGALQLTSVLVRHDSLLGITDSTKTAMLVVGFPVTHVTRVERRSVNVVATVATVAASALLVGVAVFALTSRWQYVVALRIR